MLNIGIYLLETNQIADILVEHSEEGIEGLVGHLSFNIAPLTLLSQFEVIYIYIYLIYLSCYRDIIGKYVDKYIIFIAFGLYFN
ncbi:hypothetical protein ACA30_01685 [Virgibacillus soli]|nr:hypothetical protein ACA30_01685 [Virgibacillus soli]